MTCYKVAKVYRRADGSEVAESMPNMYDKLSAARSRALSLRKTLNRNYRVFIVRVEMFEEEEVF